MMNMFTRPVIRGAMFRETIQMKKLLIIVTCIVLIAQFMVRQAWASEGFEDLVAVVKSGADNDALTAYIEASPAAYSLSVDEILFLNDLGVSSEMISAIISHGRKVDGDAVPVSLPAPVAEIVEPMPPAAEPPPPAAVLPPADVVVQETVIAAPDVATLQPEAVDVSSFYGALSPYGSWVNVDGTWYWQPTAVIVDRNWSPYCQRGYWVYTDCGWMWQSNYSWGWAPFHYGRWHRHSRYGWIWMPGNVWGPAWVSWRHCGEAVGWAPLPPGARFEEGRGFFFGGMRVDDDCNFGLESRHFTFVPVSHFCDRAPERYRLPHTEVERVFGRTTVVRNRHEAGGGNVVNRGPQVAQIQAATHREIKPVTVVDQKRKPGVSIRAGRPEGGSVVVYRPNVAPTAHETPLAAVVRNQAAAQVRHDEVRHVSVIETYKSGPAVQAEQAHGRATLETVHPAAAIPITSRQSVVPVVDRNHAEEAAARERKADEALARLREEQKQRAAEMLRQQEQKRNEDAIARQRYDQRRKTEELIRQQADQQRKTVEQARQQDDQRQHVAEQASQKEEQRRVAQAAQRQAEEAAASQRQAEESNARQRVQQQQKTQQNTFQNYGNSSTTREASSRGSSSRDSSRNDRNR